jgi:hypothetical protein
MSTPNDGVPQHLIDSFNVMRGVIHSESNALERIEALTTENLALKLFLEQALPHVKYSAYMDDKDGLHVDARATRELAKAIGDYIGIE